MTAAEEMDVALAFISQVVGLLLVLFGTVKVWRFFRGMVW